LENNVENSRPVIVGYAPGAAGDAALRVAGTEARLRHASVTIVHKLIGVDAPEAFGHQDNAAGKTRAAINHLRGIAHDVIPDVDSVDVRIVMGRIAEELLLASQSASMIVVGVTTDHAASAAALNTVPRELAQRSQCPVLVVPAATAQTDCTGIVCGIDRSAASISALLWAAHEADLRGVAVHAVEILAQHLHRSTPTAVEPLSDWVQANLPISATTVICSTEFGSPAHRLLETAAERRGLLVIGGHEHVGLMRRSVARVVTSQTRVPVAVVPRLAISETPTPVLAL
jgi:nucleotide-binding universal stress UspA family protein